MVRETQSQKDGPPTVRNELERLGYEPSTRVPFAKQGRSAQSVCSPRVSLCVAMQFPHLLGCKIVHLNRLCTGPAMCDQISSPFVIVQSNQRRPWELIIQAICT